MNVTLRPPRMTREQFLDWVERQEAPFEFDGAEPVIMTGNNRSHGQICANLIYELRRRLVDVAVYVLPEGGVATGAQAVRYPDVLVTRTAGPGSARLMPDPLIVFEVVSPTSVRTDHYHKLREYHGVPTIRRYVIVQSATPDLLVYWRDAAAASWTVVPLGPDDTLALPEIGIDLPVAEVFAGVTFAEAEPPTESA